MYLLATSASYQAQFTEIIESATRVISCFSKSNRGTRVISYCTIFCDAEATVPVITITSAKDILLLKKLLLTFVEICFHMSLIMCISLHDQFQLLSLWVLL